MEKFSSFIKDNAVTLFIIAMQFGVIMGVASLFRMEASSSDYANFSEPNNQGKELAWNMGEKVVDIIEDLQSKSSMVIARKLTGSKDSVILAKGQRNQETDAKDWAFDQWATTEMNVRNLVGFGINNKIDWGSVKHITTTAVDTNSVKYDVQYRTYMSTGDGRVILLKYLGGIVVTKNEGEDESSTNTMIRFVGNKYDVSMASSAASDIKGFIKSLLQ